MLIKLDSQAPLDQKGAVQATAGLWNDIAREAEHNARRFERQQTKLRSKLSKVGSMELAVLAIEHAGWECPACGTANADDDITGNRLTCAQCKQSWGIKTWLLPRNSGHTQSISRSTIAEMFHPDTSPEDGQDSMARTSVLRSIHIWIGRAMMQCPSCSQFSPVKGVIRNSLQCARCRRHWEAVLRLACPPRETACVIRKGTNCAG
jgi:hypothetical protein